MLTERTVVSWTKGAYGKSGHSKSGHVKEMCYFFRRLSIDSVPVLSQAHVSKTKFY